MGSSERRLRNKQKQHDDILLAAISFANEYGWEGVTMRRISERIEYTLPVIYTHFKSKDEIIQTVASDGFKQLATTLKDSIKSGSKEQTIQSIIKSYVDFAVHNRILYEAMYGLNGVQSILQNNRLAEGEKLFIEVLSQLKATVPNIKTDLQAEITLKILWSQLHGLVTLHYIGLVDNVDTGLKLDDIVDTFVSLFNKFFKT
jgi:AcrR family transcriptional regulator